MGDIDALLTKADAAERARQYRGDVEAVEGRTLADEWTAGLDLIRDLAAALRDEHRRAMFCERAWENLKVLLGVPDLPSPFGIASIDLSPWTDEEIAFARRRAVERGWTLAAPTEAERRAAILDAAAEAYVRDAPTEATCPTCGSVNPAYDHYSIGDQTGICSDPFHGTGHTPTETEGKRK